MSTFDDFTLEPQPSPATTGADEAPAGRKPWFSPSRLKTFLECPRKYDFSVVQKIPGRPSPHLDLGSNVHAALRDFLRLPPAQRTWEALLEAYRAAWRANKPAFARRTRDELRDWGERGKAMLQRFFDEVAPDLEPLALEKNVRIEFADFTLGGRVDRVDALPDGTLRVVDYKTGKFPRDLARAREDDLAAAIYARGTSEAFVGAPVSVVEYLHLGTMERLVFPVDPAWQAHKETAVVVLAGRAREAEVRGTFEAQPSNFCRWCDYLQRCREGRAFLDDPDGRG